MKVDFPVEGAIRNRYSVRNYLDKPVEQEKKELIADFVKKLDNPFGKKISFYFLNMDGIGTKEKLGTYGVIKGARQYIGATVKYEPYALFALGYEFEIMVLYLAHMGIGTCWLGGTFDREGFASAMDIEEGVLFPIISPYGYAAEKKHMKEVAMRTMIKADHRKNWDEVFFSKDFNRSLSQTEAGDFKFALEMVRLGPSASNKQPWRIIHDGDRCHFFQYKEPGYSKNFPYDIQKIDMGIAAAHFDVAMKEKGIAGHFETSVSPEIVLPKNVEYSFTWIRD